MRLLVISIALLVTISQAVAQDQDKDHDQDRADFSGAWKRDCTKTYGLKISRAADDRFAVTFCFPAGCNDHAWIAGTPIAGDPKFKIVSDDEIGLRRVDNPETWLMYRRCSRDPASWDATNPAGRRRDANSDQVPK